MDDKSKKLIQRYVDGEKQLMSKLTEIHASLEDDNTCPYVGYLKSLFEDDYEKMFAFKKLIQKDISHKGLKPNFPKKNSNFLKRK